MSRKPTEGFHCLEDLQKVLLVKRTNRRSVFGLEDLQKVLYFYKTYKRSSMPRRPTEGLLCLEELEGVLRIEDLQKVFTYRRRIDNLYV